MQMSSPAHLGQRDGVAQRVGEMDIGVEARRVLDRQRHTRPLGMRRALRDHLAEPFGSLSPAEWTPPAGEQVDGACADCGGPRRSLG